MRTDHDRKNEHGGDDKLTASASDKRIEEISADVFDDAQDDACDHGAKDTVETTENGCELVSV